MKNYNFILKQKNAYIIVAVIFLLGIASFIIRGFNLDIDFIGGAELTYDLSTEVTDDVQSKVREGVIEKIGKEKYSSVGRSGSDSEVLIVRTQSLTQDEIDSIEAMLTEMYPETESQSISKVGSTISSGTRTTVLMSTLIAVVLMLVYITIRFQFTSGLSAILCLVFNLYAMLTLYSLAQIPLNQNVIAACLTILGYSINATIIIFDRIRENSKKNPEAEFTANADLGIHQTLNRSVFTTFTTLLTIGMVYILGVEQIRNFALPLIMGIVAGLFSSVFLAGPIWGSLNKVFKRNEKLPANAKKAKSK